MSPHQQAAGQLLGGAVFISLSPVFVTLADIAPTVSAFYRMFIGAATLTLLAWLMGRLKVNPGTLRYIIPCALLFALDLWFWHRSILAIGPGLSTLIGNLQVFFVALTSALWLREPPSRLVILSIVIGFSGLVLVLSPDWSGSTDHYRLGVFYGVMTALCYTFFLLSLRGLQRLPGQGGSSTITSICIISWMCAALLGATAWFEGSEFGLPHWQGFGALLGYGVLSQAAGWVLISRGMSVLPATIAGLFLLLQPTLAYIWDVSWFDGHIALIQGLGIVLVLCGIYLGGLTPARVRAR